jgi:hypothetical protein
MQEAVVARVGWVTVTPQGIATWPAPASAPSSSRVIVDLRFVMPVTTASGKATSGMGVAVGVGWGVGLGLGDGLGLGPAHPTSMVTTATAVTPRRYAGRFTALS